MAACVITCTDCINSYLIYSPLYTSLQSISLYLDLLFFFSTCLFYESFSTFKCLSYFANLSVCCWLDFFRLLPPPPPSSPCYSKHTWRPSPTIHQFTSIINQLPQSFYLFSNSFSLHRIQPFTSPRFARHLQFLSLLLPSFCFTKLISFDICLSPFLPDPFQAFFISFLPDPFLAFFISFLLDPFLAFFISFLLDPFLAFLLDPFLAFFISFLLDPFLAVFISLILF
ncbi:DRD5 [Acanthosepion pharaonis]|uniref:DRD5 n=1 Tax=Acanthosepion pharaonis TaxID=158019 RepID=A0A812D2V9_ACAPH|nr:DRD5 [Sepia pharaonis]